MSAIVSKSLEFSSICCFFSANIPSCLSLSFFHFFSQHPFLPFTSPTWSPMWSSSPPPHLRLTTVLYFSIQFSKEFSMEFLWTFDFGLWSSKSRVNWNFQSNQMTNCFIRHNNSWIRSLVYIMQLQFKLKTISHCVNVNEYKNVDFLSGIPSSSAQKRHHLQGGSFPLQILSHLHFRILSQPEHFSR